MPPGRGLPRAGFPVGCPFPPLCRAGVHARRTDDFFKIIMCGGVKTPPYKEKQTTDNPQTPNTRKVCRRHVCRPYA